jgi:hypothetical protein
VKPLHFLLIPLCLASAANAADPPGSVPQLLQTYCVQCHGADKQKGDIRLDDPAKLNRKHWELIYDQLASGEMPPDDKKQPTEAERGTLSAAFLAAISNAGGAAPGVTFRRLNKREYGQTVRDLLGLQSGTFDPAEYIYDDEITDGFDTRATSLVISNELLIEYMQAAQKALRQALFSAGSTPPTKQTIDVNFQKIEGVASRYSDRDEKSAVIRVGGSKSKFYDGTGQRTMQAAGRYRITLTACGVDRDRYPSRFAPESGPLILGFGILQDGLEALSASGKRLETFELKDNEDQTFTFDTWIEKGHFPYINFENGHKKPIVQVRALIRHKKLPATASNEQFHGPGIKLSQFKIEGPFYDEWPPASFRAVYGSDTVPNLADPAARTAVVQRFARRAFRRPVQPAEIQPYLTFLEAKHAVGNEWHEALIDTLAAMMTSVDFLYIMEGAGPQGKPTNAKKLNPHELAARLSYFLGSSLPDAELSALADSGRLLEPAVLAAQTERLMRHPGIQRFCDSFADQWLSLDTLGTMPPDIKDRQFKAYHKDKLEPAMRQETRLFFRNALVENRPVREFIDSDYSFVNASLAKLYDVPFKGGRDEFVRIVFPPEAKRGGLLGQASILTLTSNGVETSPVVRGHWVLSELLGTPPPPAPKEVPALVPDLNGATSVRQLLDKHRTDATCAECHRQMDPLGFALESYDPIGRLRSNYSKTMRVETDGNYKGRPFANVAELQKIMQADLRPFARNLVIRIAEYAKGRQLTAADLTTVDALLNQSAATGYPLKQLVIRIATSELLTTR